MRWAFSTLPWSNWSRLRDRDVVVAFENILDIVAIRLREAGDTASDPLAQDLLTGIAAEIEKQAWVVRSHR